MSSKYMNVLESVFAGFSILIGAQSVNPPQLANTITVGADGQTTIKDGVPSQDVTINPPASQLGTNILVVCTYLSIGIPILSIKLIEAYKGFKKVNDESAEGQLSKCKEEKAEMTKSLASMATSMDLLQKSNEALNKTIAAQVETIARTSAPIVMSTSEVIHKTDT